MHVEEGREADDGARGGLELRMVVDEYSSWLNWGVFKE